MLVSFHAALLVMLWTALLVADVHPIIPTFERFNGTGSEQTREHIATSDQSLGSLLAEELNCVSCHASEVPVRAKQAPLLGEVSGRINGDYLRTFLADPHGTKPGTTMPNLFVGKSAEERDVAVEALVHFLTTLGPGQPAQDYAPLGGRQRGKELFHQVGCVACHDPETTQLATSVPLGPLDQKYTLVSLADFLIDPLHVRPSGRMPSLNLSQVEARDIAAYLLPNVPEKGGIEVAYFEGRFGSIAELAAATPTTITASETINPRGPARRRNAYGLRYRGTLLISTAGEYQFHLGSDDGSRLLVNDDEVIMSDGVHGMQWEQNAIQLAPGRHAIQVDYFEDGGEEELQVEIEGPGLERQPLDALLVASSAPASIPGSRIAVDTALAAKGKVYFAELGCANCHDVGQPIVSAMTAKGWKTLGPTGGCVAESPTQGVNYRLSPRQREVLAAAITQGLPLHDSRQQVQHATMQFNCLACHERDGLGGVETARTDLFQTTQKEMGMEGSIPPGLDGVGAKLTRAWLEQILANGAKDRPYMLTRMPKFGEANIGHLGATLEQLDQIEPLPAMELPRREARRAGHQLVGSRGFSCIQCHTFGPHRATGVQSIDMTIMTKRLRADWFRRYVRNPALFRPGTRMPNAWPAEKSLLANVLDGSSEQQIVAVWTYLGDGVRAKTPEGITTAGMELVPGEEAILYRNFIEGAGPRAIGVGYPEGMHLAFDANSLSLALIWQGAFIDASLHWSGRGQGFQSPAGQKVKTLVDGIPIATLERSDSVWPSIEPSHVARQPGQSFRGYRLSSDGRPTFLYEVGTLAVEDFPNPIESATSVSLSRTLTLRGTAPANTFLRLARGTIKQDGAWYDLGDGLRLRVANREAVQIVLREVAGEQELLVRVGDQDTHQIQLEYVW